MVPSALKRKGQKESLLVGNRFFYPSITTDVTY
jgi:hypothetical protein